MKLQELPKLVVGDARSFDDGFEGVGVDSRMPRNGHEMFAVAQGDVFSDAHDTETRLGESPNHPFAGEIREKHQAGTRMSTSTSLAFFLTRETAPKYSLIADLILLKASRRVVPWLAQPGKAGQDVSYPYLLLWTMTKNRVFIQQ